MGLYGILIKHKDFKSGEIITSQHQEQVSRTLAESEEQVQGRVVYLKK